MESLGPSEQTPLLAKDVYLGQSPKQQESETLGTLKK